MLRPGSPSWVTHIAVADVLRDGGERRRRAPVPAFSVRQQCHERPGAGETARNVVEMFYFGTANQDVMDAITDPELIEVLALNDPTVFDRAHFTPNLTPEQRDARAEMWVDVKAS